ncbi:PREDICTED: armadillo repeat-containing protein 1-like isoform X1 [Priapulus caudatus]|uniref:Armadillo repeat-containing protein 1-like isoform X1 n=1 Tax=Priapulus caudatus TaxID=37621 RepID=A0ABM1E4Y6_PRICU|nr:PREDICTED: armadillo repeat-containing protein 1-like isoform X1 [Priapulus caudatus]XP_014667257.1 PREDICTED: armadillo repeat-containing protein 1-like isoform X1 [Priapulus caudatus]
MNEQKLSTATLATVTTYRQLATDPVKRAALIKDSACVAFLIYVLDDKCIEVVKNSLQTLWALCESAHYRPMLKNTYGFIPALETVATNTGFDHYCQKLARELLSLLKKELHCRPKDAANMNPASGRAGHKSKRQSHQFLLGSARSKTVVLQLKGMVSQDHRRVCEAQLLRVRGVISITFDHTKLRCIARVRADIKPEALVQAVAKTKVMSAEQVIKNEQGEEILICFDKRSDQNKENTQLPPYLPEEDSPVRAKAVARAGDDGQGGSWMSVAANFISKSFYW